MKTLSTWPKKANPESTLIKYLDGQIYEFSLDDVKKFGYDQAGLGPDRVGSWRYDNPLHVFKEDLLAIAREKHGPWQTRTMISYEDKSPKSLVFQFTGLKECRASKCLVKAIPSCDGYCKKHRPIESEPMPQKD